MVAVLVVPVASWSCVVAAEWPTYSAVTPVVFAQTFAATTGALAENVMSAHYGGISISVVLLWLFYFFHCVGTLLEQFG